MVAYISSFAKRTHACACVHSTSQTLKLFREALKGCSHLSPVAGAQAAPEGLTVLLHWPKDQTTSVHSQDERISQGAHCSRWFGPSCSLTQQCFAAPELLVATHHGLGRADAKDTDLREI